MALPDLPLVDLKGLCHDHQPHDPQPDDPQPDDPQLDDPQPCEPFPIFDLPYELRIHILSFLLPDLPTIECDKAWSPLREFPPRKYSQDMWSCNDYSAWQFRSDEGSNYMEVLRANRQLWKEGMDYLYERKSFKITVSDFGIDFLRDSDQLPKLPVLPYHRCKEFVIQIYSCFHFVVMAHRLRENVAWVCGLLNHHNVRFQKLRITFPDYECWGDRIPMPADTPEEAQYEKPNRCHWNWAWDSRLPQEEDVPETVSFADVDEPNNQLDIRDWGFHSTFHYMLSPVALLGHVANEVSIEVPPELRERKYTDDEGKERYYMVELAEWYREGLDGTCDFSEEEDWLRWDREWFESLKTETGYGRWFR
ncbi:MAG: hypothetical protein Q9218_002616 [Villophora microphyllina]